MAATDKTLDVFEERAENIPRTDLETWTYLSAHENQIVRKLKGPGAKLISGPRGSGKSTLLRRAYFDLLSSRSALPVYVNYSRALALEPLFHTHANALQLFRQWVLAKAVLGLGSLRAEWGLSFSPEVSALFGNAEHFVRSLESGEEPELGTLSLSPSRVVELLESLATAERATRVVLLLDDAAHAFSLKQQREFFEIFRELRSRHVAAKAAIYPGVTAFSPSFQVGHEAEVLEVWFRPDSDGYLAAMREIASKRIPSEQLSQLGTSRDEYIDLLALAAFGLPRGFLNMLSDLIDSVQSRKSVHGLRKAVLDTIDAQSDSVRQIFHSVGEKLPRFKNFVLVGEELERAAMEALRDFNRNKSTKSKAVTLAISDPVSVELARVLQFMEYAGLARKIASLSKGEKGNYERYFLHYAPVIASNALFLGRSYRLSEITESLRKPSAHALVKAKAESLIGRDYLARCVLALPACSRCATPRISEEQRFCMHCGQELSSASIYLELLKKEIGALPLPARKIEALRQAGVTTVQQLLSDDQNAFRKQGSYIGPIWSRRIRTIAEEFVSV